MLAHSATSFAATARVQRCALPAPRVAGRSTPTIHCQAVNDERRAETVCDRRQMLQVVTGSVLLPVLLQVQSAQAEELVTELEIASGVESVAIDDSAQLTVVADETTQEPTITSEITETQAAVPERVYLDVKLEGKPLGRITVELFPQVAVGSARFRDLAVGKQGVGYRLNRFDGIFSNYIRCEGVKSLSYAANQESPIAGGDNLLLLEAELESQTLSHDTAGLVSLVVAETSERPSKEKMIARDGKFVTIVQQFGEAPNGTSFVITRGAEPSLDKTNLIVGRVVDGMEVVEAVGALPYARPRDSYYDQPFFTVAKAIGDRRADTAEKGFNRPLKRVIVSGGGLL